MTHAAERMRRYRQRLKSERRCTRCGDDAEVKPDGSYYNMCSKCRAEVNVNLEGWRKDNPGYSKAYWAEHKDGINKRRRKVSA